MLISNAITMSTLAQYWQQTVSRRACPTDTCHTSVQFHGKDLARVRALSAATCLAAIALTKWQEAVNRYVMRPQE